MGKANPIVLSVAMGLYVLVSLTSIAGAQVGKIRVVYTDWFPYTYQKDGQASGFEVEILKAVLTIMDIDAEFAAYPWNRCLNELENARADALVSMLRTADREKYTEFPETHISLSKTVFFTTSDKEIVFNGSYEKLSGYRIGIIMGFSYGDAFDSADYLEKDSVYNAEMLIRKLLAGRNDLAAENQAVVIASARKMGVIEKIKFLTPPIHTRRLFVGFSKAKGLKQLSRDFSLTLSEFKNTDMYRTIIEKYGLEYADMED